MATELERSSAHSSPQKRYMYIHLVHDTVHTGIYVCCSDLEHERITEFDGQLQLLDEVGVIEGGDTEVVSLLFLADPVEGLLLWVNAERVTGGLQEGRGGEGERGRGRRRGGEGREEERGRRERRERREGEGRGERERED